MGSGCGFASVAHGMHDHARAAHHIATIAEATGITDEETRWEEMNA